MIATMPNNVMRVRGDRNGTRNEKESEAVERDGNIEKDPEGFGR